MGPSRVDKAEWVANFEKALATLDVDIDHDDANEAALAVWPYASMLNPNDAASHFKAALDARKRSDP